MNQPSLQDLYEVTEATWPAAALSEAGGFTIRDGQGGGKRVSAATLCAGMEQAEIATAEQAMRQLGQRPLFMIREGDEALDKVLSDRGYQLVDPVNVYLCKAEILKVDDIPRTIAIPAWEPLHIMQEIWATGGIGPERVNVMRRACAPKTGIISRYNDQPAGTSFMAMHKGVAMLHALEVLPTHRRSGLGGWAMRRAAEWTLRHAGSYVSVLCTQANDAANGLYSGLGMSLIGTYHYRSSPE